MQRKNNHRPKGGEFKGTTCIFIAVLIKLAIVFISLDSVNSVDPETHPMYDKALTVRFRTISEVGKS